MKLTRKQSKDRERILAWLNGQPFKENTRAKAVVPDLTTEQIIRDYIPPNPHLGQYFTSPEMARILIDEMGIQRHPSGVTRILDPCAGIGNLFYPIRTAVRRYELHAYEIEQECYQIGARLYHGIDWHWLIPFGDLERIEGTFDYVLMNPPFGNAVNLDLGRKMAEGRSSKPEHLFLELAVRALRPGGWLFTLGSHNYLDRMPKALKAWFNERAEVFHTRGPLPGAFKYTKQEMHAYYIRRLYAHLPIVMEVDDLVWNQDQPTRLKVFEPVGPVAAVGNVTEPKQLALL